MRWFVKFRLALLSLVVVAPTLARAATEIEGVSFADDPHMLLVPIEEIAPLLGWELRADETSKQIFLNGQSLGGSQLRKLTNGTVLVPLNELQRAGAAVTWSDEGTEAVVASGFF